MNGWEIFGIVVAALIVIAIPFNLRDLIRYLKIRAM
jgi:hypothetical protein